MSIQKQDVYCEYVSSEVDAILSAGNVLAVIDFSSSPQRAAELGITDRRYINSGMANLSEQAVSGQPVSRPSVYEVWYGKSTVVSGVDESVSWSHDGSALIAAVVVSDIDSVDLNAATKDAYLHILSVIAAKGFPYIVRAWNYLAGINEGEGDQERYKQFCAGRHEALAEANYALDQFPAASALGNQNNSLVIYVLAAAKPAQQVENPQQVSAYRYPREYGPRPPSFARASVKRWGESYSFYLSGTASVVGHKTECVGDLTGQLEVTFKNIHGLYDHAMTACSLENDRVREQLLKVYVRHQHDYADVRRYIESRVDADVVYLHADVCRRDLLVEIDGVGVVVPVQADVNKLDANEPNVDS